MCDEDEGATSSQEPPEPAGGSHFEFSMPSPGRWGCAAITMTAIICYTAYQIVKLVS